MQILQITLTTEFWLQALIPSYLYYVSPWKLNWCKDLFSDWCEIFRKNYWYQSCRRKLCDVSECLQCYRWIVFRIYHWFPQLYWMWGKAKPLKLMTKRFRYIKAFSMFGKEITLADSLVSKLEMFVCHMYGWKENGVDNVRYHMYCKSGGKVSCDTLLPTNDVVHISSADYQAYICWQSLVAQQEQLDTIIMVGCTMAKKIVWPLSWWSANLLPTR